MNRRTGQSQSALLLLLSLGSCMLSVKTTTAFVSHATIARHASQGVPSALGVSRSTAGSSSGTSSWVEFTDPETGCDVVLLGCLHGSQSSSADVEMLFPGTDVLVLELCESRFTELRKSVVKEASATTEQLKKNKPQQVEWSDYVRMVTVMSEKGGWSTGLAAAVLGGMSGWQTALTGMTPGLEFRTGLRLALATSAPSSSTSTARPCDIILADQDVTETLRRIGQLPEVSWNLLQEWIQSGSWQDTMAPEARSLNTAICGNDRLRPYQLRTMDVLRRNQAVLQDILRVSAPSVIVGYVTLTLLANLFPAAADASIMATAAAAAQQGVVDVGGNNVMLEAIFNVVLLITGYIGVLLPATRVVLSERDDQLYKGIQAACRVAAAKQPQGNNGRPARVLAVVGLLHVNGVAERLLSNQLLQETL